jgi:hypothetical protein
LHICIFYPRDPTAFAPLERIITGGQGAPQMPAAWPCGAVQNLKKLF